MSKIGKKPIQIPEGTQVQIVDNGLKIKGKLGELEVKILDYVEVKIDDNILSFSIKENKKQAKSNWGTMRALTFNAIKGVSEGFEKILEMEGVGYKASMEGSNLVLNVGFSHPVKIAPPEGIKIEVEGTNIIKVKGIDKALVGQVAADIRKIRKPEPYKGKGIRYQGEVIRRKEGKKAVGAGS